MSNINGYKKVIYQCCDKLDSLPMINAIHEALKLSMPFCGIGFVCYLLSGAMGTAGGYSTGRVVDFAKYIVARIGEVAFIAVSIVITLSIVERYITEKDRNNHLLSSTGMVTALVNFIIFTGVDETTNNLGFLSMMGVPVAMISGMFTARHLWVIYNKMPAVKNREQGVAAGKRLMLRAGLPSALLTVVIAFITEMFVEFVTDGKMLHDLVIKVLNIGLIFGKKHVILNEAFFVVYRHILNLLGINSEMILAKMESELMPYKMAINGIIPKTNFFSILSVASTGMTAFTLAVAIMIFSEHNYKKNYAAAGLFPAVCAVPEFVIYGLKIVLNPIYVLPYITVPLINYFMYYGVTSAGIIEDTVIGAKSKQLFVLLGFAAGGNVQFLFVIVLIVIDVLIFAPFVKMHDEYENYYHAKHTDEIVSIVRECSKMGRQFSVTKLNSANYLTADFLINTLRNAVKNESPITLFFQPIVDSEGRVYAAEGTLYWNANRGAGYVLAPMAFSFAEAGGFLREMLEFIFDDAVKMLRWLQNANVEVAIGINLTERSFMVDGIVDLLDGYAVKYEVKRELIALEISETDAMALSVDKYQKLQNFKNRGYKIILDSYGGGHPSSRYLQFELFDGIKIGGDLVRDIADPEFRKSNALLISGIIGISKKFGLFVAAEHIQDEQQRKVLEELGVNYFQGPGLQGPMDPDTFENYMLENMVANRDFDVNGDGQERQQ